MDLPNINDLKPSSTKTITVAMWVLTSQADA
jgi:hypothetical protein